VRGVRLIGLSLIVFLVFACLPVVHAAWVYHAPSSVNNADMLVIYGGSYPRYEAGLQAERQGQYKYLVFSDMRPADVAAFFKRHGLPRHAEILPEPEARSTTQNAYYSVRLARRHGVQTMVVATDWYHLPRALALTHLAIGFSGPKVQGLLLNPAPAQWWRSRVYWAEYVKLWGSLVSWWGW
jgi:uncharacterized SAM-binding protein YcdF (DUF218 family)